MGSFCSAGSFVVHVCCVPPSGDDEEQVDDPRTTPHPQGYEALG